MVGIGEIGVEWRGLEVGIDAPIIKEKEDEGKGKGEGVGSKRIVVCGKWIFYF